MQHIVKWVEEGAFDSFSTMNLLFNFKLKCFVTFSEKFQLLPCEGLAMIPKLESN